MKAKTLLTISSSIELATGIALIASPRLVANVLISAELTPGGEAVGRVGGCALLSLAIACWPRTESEADLTQPIRALFLYNLFAGCYLGYLAISGDFASFFLIPAAALHIILALLLIRPVYHTAKNHASEI
jgi:hypothetical protein